MHLGRSPASPYPDIYRSQGCEGTLRDPQFTTLFDGVLMSVPGADTQHWHRDSGVNTECLSHVSVYVSTSNVEQAMGPTQFLPGTNLDFGFQFSEWTGFFNHCPDMRAPLLPAGGMLIWEFRTLHRGTRNVHASKRPMLYKIYRLKDTWRDVNMGQKSFYSRVSQAQ
jgi:ectoine hydroxylase-related dioxygenase (phytanoyl-CoA dioxygenase family)